MRSIGVFLLCLGGIGIADALLKALRRGISRTKALLGFVLYVRDSVENYAMPISEIFEGCDVGMLRECGWLKEEGTPCELSAFFEECDINDRQVRAILSDLSREFGKSYRARQSELLGICVERLRARVAQLETELPQRRKLAVGACVGGTLILLLLLL